MNAKLFTDTLQLKQVAAYKAVLSVSLVFQHNSDTLTWRRSHKTGSLPTVSSLSARLNDLQTPQTKSFVLPHMRSHGGTLAEVSA